MQLEILIPPSVLHSLFCHRTMKHTHGATGGSVHRTVEPSITQAAQVTYQEVLLAIDLPVDVVERFPSQPPP